MHEMFWPKVNDLGFEGASLATFGMTTEVFNEVFEDFLDLPIEEQLEIIPVI